MSAGLMGFPVAPAAVVEPAFLQQQARRLGRKAQAFSPRDINAVHGVQSNLRRYAVWVPILEGFAIRSVSVYLANSAVGTTTAEVGVCGPTGLLLGRGNAAAAWVAVAGLKTIDVASEPGRSLEVVGGVDDGVWFVMESAGSSTAPRFAGRAPVSGTVGGAVENVALSGYIGGAGPGIVGDTIISSLTAGSDTDIWVALS